MEHNWLMLKNSQFQVWVVNTHRSQNQYSSTHNGNLYIKKWAFSITKTEMNWKLFVKCKANCSKRENAGGSTALIPMLNHRLLLNCGFRLPNFYPDVEDLSSFATTYTICIESRFSNCHWYTSWLFMSLSLSLPFSSGGILTSGLSIYSSCPYSSHIPPRLWRYPQFRNVLKL
jgi:hypothetical protein